MDGEHHLNEKENNCLAMKKGSRVSNNRSPCNGQLSFGR